MPAPRKQQQGPSPGSLQVETGLCLSADDGRQQHLSRSRIEPAMHANTVGQRARPGSYHTGQAPPDDTGGLLDLIVAETARRCIKEVDEATDPLGADSSAAETTRYEYVKRPNREERDFVETRQKTYWKYHITTILGLQIALAAFTTPGNINDATMLPVMLAAIRCRGFDFAENFFGGDKGYDSGYSCELLFWMGMISNIRQRKDAVSRGKSHRRKAAGLFSDSEYRKEAPIEDIFGTEETRRHQLRCRFARKDNRRLFAKGRAIAWNIRILNRFEYANRLNIPIPSYGSMAHVECT